MGDTVDPAAVLDPSTEVGIAAGDVIVDAPSMPRVRRDDRGLIGRLDRLALVHHAAGPAVLLGVLGAHLWRLGEVPSGFFVDEAGIALAARGIALDGRDDHGQLWPLFFQSFNDWKSPIEIYLTAGFVRLLGDGVWVIRLAPALLSVGTALALAWAVQELFGRRWLSLAVLAVAGITPGLLTYGRMGFEVSALPACLALALGAWARYERRGGWRWLILAGAAIGLSGYAYAAGRPFAVLVGAALVVAYLGTGWRRWGPALLAAEVAAVVYFPILLWARGHPGAMTARLDQGISISTTARSGPELIDHLWRVYTSAWSPAYLFQTSWFIQGGALYASLAPLLALGVIALWRHRHEPIWRFVALAAFLAPVPASLTTDFGHPVRLLEGTPFLLLIAALGAMEIGSLLPPRALRLGALALALALAVEAGSFLSDYFTLYPQRIADWQQAGFDQAAAAALAAAHEPASSGSIVISNQILGGDVLLPYYQHEALPIYRVQGLAAYRASVGDVSRPGPPGAVIVTRASEAPPQAQLLETVTRPQVDSWGRASAVPAYRIWRAT